MRSSRSARRALMRLASRSRAWRSGGAPFGRRRGARGALPTPSGFAGGVAPGPPLGPPWGEAAGGGDAFAGRGTRGVAPPTARLSPAPRAPPPPAPPPLTRLDHAA